MAVDLLQNRQQPRGLPPFGLFAALFAYAVAVRRATHLRRHPHPPRFAWRPRIKSEAGRPKAAIGHFHDFRLGVGGRATASSGFSGPPADGPGSPTRALMPASRSVRACPRRPRPQAPDGLAPTDYRARPPGTQAAHAAPAAAGLLPASPDEDSIPALATSRAEPQPPTSLYPRSRGGPRIGASRATAPRSRRAGEVL